MARISRDILESCIKLGKCIDCYLRDEDEPFVKLQRRGNLKVPCCKAHFYAYKNKVNEANAKKYARRSAAKRKAGLCVAPGCHNKLIPQELLPSWGREKTCGMHPNFRAIPASRTSLLRFITEHWLTDEQRRGTAQNIIYKRRMGITLFSIQYSGWYHTMVIATSDLLRRYEASLSAATVRS